MATAVVLPHCVQPEWGQERGDLGPRVAAPPDCLCLSSGGTGLERPHTKPAGPVPSARPATEVAARTTCVTEVGNGFKTVSHRTARAKHKPRGGNHGAQGAPSPALLQPPSAPPPPSLLPPPCAQEDAGFSPPVPWGPTAALDVPPVSIPRPDSELGLNAASPQTGPCPCLLVLIVRYETDNKQGIKSKQLDCDVPGSSRLGRAFPQGILPVLVPHLPPPPRQTWALSGWAGSSPTPRVCCRHSECFHSPRCCKQCTVRA